MDERQKLIELIGQVQYLGGLELALADHLIINDVIPVVRCKNCRYYIPDSDYCGMWGEVRHPEHYCEEGDPECGK
jgi:hypothetical protein